MKKSSDIGGSKSGINAMGNTAKVSTKGKEHMKLVPGASEMKPMFDEKNDIWPEDMAKKKNPGLEESMFGKDALTSGMPADGKYASKKSKKAKYDPSVFKHKDNQMWPDGGMSATGPVN